VPDKISVLSLFSGVGGLDMGFEGGFKYKEKKYKKLRFKIIASYEKDSKCVETINKNGLMPVTELELSATEAQNLDKAQVLIGGFPCQDFSSCGPKKGLESQRGQLYQVLVNYMKKHKPLIVCGENVPNLARMQKGSVLEQIVNDFKSQGYKVQVWDLFAPEYGVPQSRRRLFFICTRNDLPGEPLAPKPSHLNSYNSTRWAIEDLEKLIDETVPNQSQFFLASKAKKGNGQGDEKCKAEMPSYTIRANAKSRVQFHYKLNRRLTVRECARLQTFPDNFIFPHSATTNIMQIGNAVPPVLAHAVACSIQDYLKQVLD
jgi:DNA (cytosine-5)-methyltransferase 1